MRTKMKFVIVEWWDAYSESGHYKPVKNDKGLPTISSGFLVEDSKTGVRVAQIAHLHADGDVSYKETMFVPRGMVQKVIVARTCTHQPTKAKKKP